MNEMPRSVEGASKAAQQGELISERLAGFVHDLAPDAIPEQVRERAKHLMLVDVRPLGLTGKKAEKALDAVGITVNKNTIPYDPEKPGTASGIRVGTPAVTTRGMREAEMERIGELIARSLNAKGDETVAQEISAEVLDLTRRFPVPGITPERVSA